MELSRCRAAVLKSVMALADLVFPRKLKPLTYRVPARLGRLSPGMIVRAELGKTELNALILDIHNEADFKLKGLKLKEISGLNETGPALSPAMVKLVKWASGYYMAPEGLVLKAMFGGGLFEKRRPRKAGPEPFPVLNQPLHETDGLDLADGIAGKGYKTFLLKSPDTSFERSFAVRAASGGKGVILLCPEVSMIPAMEPLARNEFGGRLRILHGGITKARRNRIFNEIASGEVDAVLGTRLAVFAPFEKVSLIAGTCEENVNYKNIEWVKYHSRDVAVMRGFLEGARVLLSSICPSAESWLNALRGKYELIEPPHAARKFRMKTVRFWASGPAEGCVAQTVRDALSKKISAAGRALVIGNHTGHSVPLCEDCGYIVRCKNCGLPLIFHKSSGNLRCGCCGFEVSARSGCARCGGLNIKLLGAGAERLEEELKTYCPAKFKPEDENSLEENKQIFILGAKSASRSKGADNKFDNKLDAKLRRENFDLIVAVNPEGPLFKPEFRARERVFRDLCYLAEKIAPGGLFLLQTAQPGLIGSLKRLDYREFIETELAERKVIGLPPFQRTALVSFKSEPPTDFPLLSDSVFLGPVRVIGKKGVKSFSITVRAKDAKSLKKALSGYLESKAVKSVPDKPVVDIDPL